MLFVQGRAFVVLLFYQNCPHDNPQFSSNNSDGSAQHVVGEEFFFYSWVASDKQATKGDYFRLEAVRSGGEMAGVSATKEPKKIKLYALDGLTFILAIDGRLYLDGKGIYTRAK